MRKSGILMHITSLPNPYGIGTVGKCAYDFVDFPLKQGIGNELMARFSPIFDPIHQNLHAALGHHLRRLEYR